MVPGAPLRVHMPVQGMWVQSLVQEVPTCRGAPKPKSHNRWSPCALELVLCNKGGHHSENLCGLNRRIGEKFSDASTRPLIVGCLSVPGVTGQEWERQTTWLTCKRTDLSGGRESVGLLFFQLFYTGVQPMNNAVIVSGQQQRDSREQPFSLWGFSIRLVQK